MNIEEISKQVQETIGKVADELKDNAKKYGGLVVMILAVIYIYKKIK